MGSSLSSSLDPHFVTACTQAADADGFVSFEQFMDIALYHPELGYYRRNRDRVGLRPQTDFFTASSLGPVFGELVLAAVLKQLSDRAIPAEQFTFVEIGAESGRTVLDGIAHPFTALQPISVGQALHFSGPCVVFSNELFDAQPCARYVKTTEGWAELGIQLETGTWSEAQRRVSPLPVDLPAEAPLGYHLDLPRRAAVLTQSIAAAEWFGLFCAFDYGKTWAELSEACPQGTVRAYREHRQSNDLFAHPGEQDLTCHICWDWIEDALRNSGFTPSPVVSQEAFLVKQAAAALAKIMTEEAHQMSPRKAGLMQLLHPSALGQKFQVLTAWRDAR
jgi:SAM-dependent MidA family methyltransferase